jgi:hypothetical protein
VHITHVFNVANAVYLPRKLLSKVDKNRNLNLITRHNKMEVLNFCLVLLSTTFPPVACATTSNLNNIL